MKYLPSVYGPLKILKTDYIKQESIRNGKKVYEVHVQHYEGIFFEEFEPFQSRNGRQWRRVSRELDNTQG